MNIKIKHLGGSIESFLLILLRFYPFYYASNKSDKSEPLHRSLILEMQFKILEPSKTGLLIFQYLCVISFQTWPLLSNQCFIRKRTGLHIATDNIS